MASSKEKIKPHIRWAIRRDMSDLVEIASHDVDRDVLWDEERIMMFLRQRNTIGMCAEWEDKILGFMLYDLHKRSLYIHGLVVHREYRRKGIGTAMICKLINKLISGRISFLEIDVPDKSLGAHLFLKRAGLLATCDGDEHYRFRFSIPKEGESGDGW